MVLIDGSRAGSDLVLFLTAVYLLHSTSPIHLVAIPSYIAISSPNCTYLASRNEPRGVHLIRPNTAAGSVPAW